MEFVITPSYCNVKVECESVLRQDETESLLTCDDLTFTGSKGDFTFSAGKADYTDGKIRPGFYVVSIKGTATDATSATSKTSTVILEFIDPCDPPLTIAAPILNNQVYTLTDDSKSPYAVPDFIIAPDFCEFVYTYEI